MRVDWSAQPLGQVSDATIARALKVTRPAVSRARIKLGIAAVVGPTTAKGIDWSCVDWSRSNKALGREHGVTEAAAREAREKQGQPRAPRFAPNKGKGASPEVQRVKQRERQRRRRRRKKEARSRERDLLATWGVWD